MSSQVRTIEVPLPGHVQTIEIGRGNRSALGDSLAARGYTKFAIFVDHRVADLFGSCIDDLASRLKAPIFRTAPDEFSKGLAFVETASTALFNAGFDRRCCLVAVGGGVLGDAVGFLAATYMRGVAMAFMPTTLMSQADTVIGKVAISARGAKNLLGAFYSPILTFCDVDFLQALPQREVSLGFSEIIKHAFLNRDDLPFVARVLTNPIAEHWRTYPFAELVERSTITKMRHVLDDPLDRTGGHKALSLGHTFANSIEALTAFGVRHGDAVALGMRAAALVSHELGTLSHAECGLLQGLLDRAGLARRLPDGLSIAPMLEAMRRDKISVGGQVSLVLPVTGGGVTVVRDLASAPIEKALVQLEAAAC